jgi:MSHA biogenesis protein MshP
MHLNQKPVPISVNKNHQQGSMLVIALFVIIVLGLLGITMTRLLSSSSETVVYEVLGQRALNAARTGVDCAVASQFGTGCNNSVNKTFINVSGLENCSYTVVVNNKPIVDGAKTFTYWTFASTGECSAGNTIVTRTVFVDAKV